MDKINVKKKQRLIPNQENIKADLNRAKVIMKSLWLSSNKVQNSFGLENIREKYENVVRKGSKPVHKIIRPMEVDKVAMKIIERDQLESLITKNGLSPVR